MYKGFYSPRILLVLVFFFTFLNTNYLLAQSAVDQFTNAGDFAINEHGDEAVELFNEKIIAISDSKRIFILTNNADVLMKGDFFSILLGGELTARGIVARSRENYLGTKIVKIYSMRLWLQLKEGTSVQILRGDDSFYRKKEERPAEEDEGPAIEDVEDIYDENIVIDDIGVVDEDKKRAIKTDNIIGIAYGMVKAEDYAGTENSYPHWSASWTYQLGDNIWGEFNFGITTLADYPGGGVDTSIQDYIFRLKYAFQAPFYSYFLPYVGYHMRKADSPDAGTDITDQQQIQRELELVEKLNENKFIVGVTVLRRLVPGWFARVDVGTDIMNIGISLEF